MGVGVYGVGVGGVNMGREPKVAGWVENLWFAYQSVLPSFCPMHRIWHPSGTEGMLSKYEYSPEIYKVVLDSSTDYGLE